MNKTLKTISVILAVLIITGVVSTANPVFAAEVNEDYSMEKSLASLQNRSVTTEENFSQIKLDTKYDYHVKDVGRAGTLYFNDFTSQLHIVRDDLSLYCPNLPVQIRSYYNSDETDYVNGLGYGWRTSYHQSIRYNAENNTFTYRDGNSNVIIFEDGGSHNSTTRKWIDVTENYTESPDYTLYTPLNDYTDLSQVTVKNKSGLTRHFDSSGYLIEITKTLENSEDSSEKTEFSVTIDYLDTNSTISALHLIEKITDCVGREYRFSYSYNSTYDKYTLTSIETYSNDSAINIGSTHYKLSFTYNFITVNSITQPTLSTVTYPDGSVVKYTTNTSSIFMKNVDGYTVEVTGINTNTQTIKEKSYTTDTSFKTGGIITVGKVNDYKKTFTDNNNISKTKQFDHYGRTVNSINNDGSIVPVVHTIADITNSKQTDELYNLHYYNQYNNETNLVENGDFSNGKSGWDATGASVVSEHSNSLKFIENGIEPLWASQIIDITDGIENDKYVVEFATKQVNNSSNTEFFSAVQLFARKNITGSEEWEELGYVEINPFNTDWHSYAREFIVAEEYNQIKIAIGYNQIGTAYFDDVKLFKSLEERQLTLEEFIETVEGRSFDITREDYATEDVLKISGDTKDIIASKKFTSTNWNNQTYTDYNGSSTRYVYNAKTGLKTRAIDENSGNVGYTYNSAGELTSVSQTVSGLGTLATSYTYTDDKISSVSHNGFSYNYEYDDWGNVTSVKVGTQPLISYDYASNNTDVTKVTYGNGDYITYSYTSSGEVSTTKSYSAEGTLKSHFAYTYTSGELTKITDVLNGTETLYDGENVTVKNTGSSENYYLAVNSSKNTIENYGGVSYNFNRENENFDLITSATYKNEENIDETKQYKFNSESDEFDRLLNKTTKTFFAEENGLEIEVFLLTEMNYKDISDTQTSLLVDSYKSYAGLCAETDEGLLTENSVEIEYFYDYDPMGNITRISYKSFNEDGTINEDETLLSYTYDKAGQLTRENNAFIDKTYVYAYDIGGNIVSKIEYDFTEDEDLYELTPTDSVSYGYDVSWKDKLTSFDGISISYDSMGNPLNYISHNIAGDDVSGTLTWNGRQLESVEFEDSRYEYFYDQDGLRTKSIQFGENNEVVSVTRFIWNGDVLSGYSIGDTEGNVVQTIKILFDDTGDSIGYTFYDATENNFQTFYFQKNLQGDIVCVLDSSGSPLVSYKYDAWGNVTPTAHGNSLQAALNAIVVLSYTPITYRGYNYDINTGLYYLQSRYYNPTYGRFLNADTTEILEKTKGTVLGANLFAYCNNNPIMNVDYTGEILGDDWPKGLIGILLAIFALIIMLYSTSDELADIEEGVGILEDAVNNVDGYSY